MINSNDRLQYKDVISKSFVGPLNTLNLAMESFMEGISAAQYKFLGPLFICIQLDAEGVTGRITFYMPLFHKPDNVGEDYIFHSYFSLGRVFSRYIKGDFEELLAPTNNLLLASIEKAGFRPTTPLFIQLGGSSPDAGCFLKIGVTGVE